MILCLDIGGTAVKMGLCDRQGVIHARKEASVCFDQYRTPILETVLREAELFLAEQQCDVEGAGISATGQIDDKRGIVIGTNGRIPHWEGSHLAEEVSARFHVPAFALNDANAAALGESFAGRAKGVENVIMLTLGTGVGGGIILGGKLYSGSLGIAGELGHFTLYADGMTCTCGKKGCFECYASTTALIARAKEKAGSEDLNGKEIFRRAQAGDRAMLSSLLNNLVDNAVKASPAGAPVELRAAPNVLAVMDHGSGMSDEALAYVNHPSRFKRLHPGGGLGVPLCHQIAKAHGAKLTYTRGADGGTVATVTFYNTLTS